MLFKIEQKKQKSDQILRKNMGSNKSAMRDFTWKLMQKKH